MFKNETFPSKSFYFKLQAAGIFRVDSRGMSLKFTDNVSKKFKSGQHFAAAINQVFKAELKTVRS